MIIRMFLLVGMCLSVAHASQWDMTWPQYDTNPFVIPLAQPPHSDSAGGLITADINNDGLMDYLVTTPGHVGAYAHNGQVLWVRQVDLRIGGSSERDGLPGHNGPGVAVTDTNGDGRAEVLFLTNDSTLHVVDGETGETLWTASPAVPEGAERWEHLAVADFRGEGPVDLLLQATNKDGYRVGRYIAAFALPQLADGDITPLWSRDDFESCAHNGARIADLDGDGRDEVIGATLVDHKGEMVYRIPLRGHTDSVFIRRVCPDREG